MPTRAVNLHPDPGLEAGWLRYDYIEPESAVTHRALLVKEVIGAVALKIDVLTNTHGVILLYPEAGLYPGDALYLGPRGTRGRPEDMGAAYVGWKIPVTAGTFYSASCWAGYFSTGIQGGLELSWLDAEGATVPLVGGGSVVVAMGTAEIQAPEYLKLSGIEAPATATTALLCAAVATTSPNLIGSATFARFMLNEGSKPEAWFSGNSGGCEWVGARHNSASLRRGNADAMKDVTEWVPAYFMEDQA